MPDACSGEFRAGLDLHMLPPHDEMEADFRADKMIDNQGVGTGQIDSRAEAPFPARAGIDRPAGPSRPSRVTPPLSGPPTPSSYMTPVRRDGDCLSARWPWRS